MYSEFFSRNINKKTPSAHTIIISHLKGLDRMMMEWRTVIFL